MSPIEVIVVVKGITLVALLFSIVFTAGVVWRVERKLDTSYKAFLAGILFEIAANVLGLFSFDQLGGIMNVVANVFHMLFALSFLAGVLWMRSIIREIDGEKEK